MGGQVFLLSDTKFKLMGEDEISEKKKTKRLSKGKKSSLKLHVQGDKLEEGKAERTF